MRRSELTHEPPAFLDALPPSLYGKPIYTGDTSGRTQYDTIQCEWLYVPDRVIWLPVEMRRFLTPKGRQPEPVGRPVAIRTALRGKNTALDVGVRFTRQRTRDLFNNAHGQYVLCARLSQTGYITVGSEISPSGRKRGGYSFEHHCDEFAQIEIGNDGVATRFRFLNAPEPITMRMITVRERVSKNDHPPIIVTTTIESHINLSGGSLNELTEELGMFWAEKLPTGDSGKGSVANIGSLLLKGTLTVDAPWIRHALDIGDLPMAQPYTASVVLLYHFRPIRQTNSDPVAVFMVSGAPAYLEVEGQPGDVLKRLEVETPQEVKQEAVDASHEQIHSSTLLTALAHAAQRGNRVVATRLRLQVAGGFGGYNTGAAGQDVYVPAELIKGLEGVSAAEVVYDPARVVVDPTTEEATPIPVLVRLGAYQTDDPYEPAADDPRKPGLCRFIPVAEFPLQVYAQSERPNSRFIAFRAPAPPAAPNRRTPPAVTPGTAAQPRQAPALWSRGGEVPEELQTVTRGTYLEKDTASAMADDSKPEVKIIRDAAAEAGLNQSFTVTVANTKLHLIQREVEGGLRVIVSDETLHWDGEDGLGADLAAMLARLQQEGHPFDVASPPLVCLTGYFLTTHSCRAPP